MENLHHTDLLPKIHVDIDEKRNPVVHGGQRAVAFIKMVVAGKEINGKKYDNLGYDFILELHRRICPIPGVEISLRESNGVTVGGDPVTTSYLDIPHRLRAYCWWLEDQMDSLKENNKDVILALNIAAAAHYGLTRPEMHPFDNGNGRTARALVNAILMTQTYELVAFGLAVPPIPILRAPTRGADAYIKKLRAIKETKTLNPFMTFLAQEWSKNLHERLEKINKKIGTPQSLGDTQLVSVLKRRVNILDEFINPKNHNGNKKNMRQYEIYPIPDYTQFKSVAKGEK